MKKTQVESRIEEEQLTRRNCNVSLTEIFCSCCCACSKCCVWTEEDYNMERINIKLSLYHIINKSLKKELLDLFKSYPNEIKELQFHKKNDMFSYKIINSNYTKENKNDKGHEPMVTFTLKPNHHSSSNSDSSPRMKSGYRRRLRERRRY
jgi:hypothetical protein